MTKAHNNNKHHFSKNLNRRSMDFDYFCILAGMINNDRITWHSNKAIFN